MIRNLASVGAAVLSAALLQQSPMGAQQTPPGPPSGAPGAQVAAAVRHDRSPALRDIPPTMVEVEGGREMRAPMPVKRGPGKAQGFRDPVLQQALPLTLMPSATVNFDGVNNVDGVLPPDTNGDVGPNHYVQWVNLSLAIYDKAGGLMYGPTNGNTIFSGFGGPCETSNDGDPIALYDEQADRWLLTQFALPNYPAGPFYQCIAVSTTGNPLGQYNRYQFSFAKMNDYPKFGVWPDGYYMSFNQFAARSGKWAGQGAAVFEREKMLAGDPTARMIYFDMASDSSLGGMLPSDLDGAPPAAGEPNVYMQFDDSPDQLQIWQFHADWKNTANSTFTKAATVGTAAFDPNMCNYARGCIPQPGTSAKLDAISDRLMYRLQYRNFGDHAAWVVNHTVDVDGTDRAGIRWYEVRKAGGAYSVFQQGTYSPDSTGRWMASAAMDAVGNIALAFNTSSSVFYPSVRYTGRLFGDTAGQMTQGEADIMGGSGSQTSTYSRWGDYSMLAVDPVDGCTFWATLEYMQTTGTAPWRTRIAAFKFPNCGAPPLTAPTGLGATAVSSSQINLAWTDNSTNEVGFKIERCMGAGCTNFAQIATVGAGVAAYGDIGLAASTSYTYRVRAYNSDGDSAYSNTATATTSQSSGAPAAPSSLQAVANGKGKIKLTWVDNSGDETSFVVERLSPLKDVPVGSNVTSYTDSGLTTGTTYSYHVKACKNIECSAWSNTASARAR
ncbi:MAG: fibronectin type III domain-containing protein [Acidobacteria bacterium]|nr:fibronectin type III domain-containing protein [Acidobacteriota bacterium]